MKYTGWCENDFKIHGCARLLPKDVDLRLERPPQRRRGHLHGLSRRPFELLFDVPAPES